MDLRFLEGSDTTAIVGYVGRGGGYYCVQCWLQKAASGSRPQRMLTTEVGDRRDVFRIIDDCRVCGTKLDYQDIRDLE